MPVAPRLHPWATKIAYKILGVPINMRTRKTEEQRRINKRLLFEETQRVR